MIMRACQFCGSEIPENARFCGVCGRTVRSSSQAVREIGNSAPPGKSVPGSVNNVPLPSAQGRSTRKPYQFSPQPYQGQQQADIPTVAYPPRTSVSSPVRQVPPIVPPATVNPGPQKYPNVQPQQPLDV